MPRWVILKSFSTSWIFRAEYTYLSTGLTVKGSCKRLSKPCVSRNVAVYGGNQSKNKQRESNLLNTSLGWASKDGKYDALPVGQEYYRSTVPQFRGRADCGHSLWGRRRQQPTALLLVLTSEASGGQENVS